MKNRNRLIMGSAIGVAAVAVAIDHTKHRLPEPMQVERTQGELEYYEHEGESPCSLDAAPCSLTTAPCSL